MKRTLRELARAIATVRAASPCRPQPPGIAPPIPIHIGLDFGATATKAVYGQPGQPGWRAIDFQHRLEEYPSYCLPSLAAITAEGELRLGIEAAKEVASGAWNDGLRRFKLLVAGLYEAAYYDHESETAFNATLQRGEYCPANFPELLAITYLVYAMHRCREAVLLLPEYAEKELEFRFTIGTPPDLYQHHQLEPAFAKIVERADLLDRKYWAPARIKPPAGAMPRRAVASSEPLAARAAYQAALPRTPGLHVLIEMGAGTTTVSFCRLQPPGDQPGRCEWLASRSFARGAFAIERAVTQLQGGGATVTGAELRQRLANPDPTLVAAEVKKICWSDDYYQLWHEAYGKYQPAPRENQAETFESAPLYLAGGGALIPGVAATLAQPYPWEKLRREHRVLVLPAPPDFASAALDFPRLAVAYGLAISPSPSDPAHPVSAGAGK